MTDDFIATPTFIQSKCACVLVCIDQIPLFYHKGPVFKELCMLFCICVICTVQCTHRRYIFVHLYLFLIWFVRYVLNPFLIMKHMILLEVFCFGAEEHLGLPGVMTFTSKSISIYGTGFWGMLSDSQFMMGYIWVLLNSYRNYFCF